METKIIRRQYAALVMLAILLSVSVVGAFGIMTIWRKTNKDVVTIMNVTTEARASELDLVLLKAEDVVDTVSSYVGARVASTNMAEAAEIRKAGLDEEINELFRSEVMHLEGAVGYYVLYSDAYRSLVNGFACRKDAGGSFSVVDSSEFEKLEKSFRSDWYKDVEEQREAVWIPIRECDYNSGYIFSYAVPIYFNDELVGAACVDVDFEVIAKPIRDISLYGNGYAYLTDDKGTVYYHPLIGYGVQLTEDDDDVPEVDNALGDTSNHGELIRYEYHGQKKVMSFRALINGMRLIITANEEDVEKETVSLINSIAVSAIVIMITFMIIALLFGQWTMHPVLDKMDSMAHIDGLTGAQNRTSFLEVMKELNSRIQEGNADFGLVMFDANELKSINDLYGHENGDIYLMSTFEMLRDCFPGFNIFRIGGDEFVVLAEGGKELKSAEADLELTYKWQEKRREEAREIWEKPSVAGAFAAYDPKEHSTAEEVLQAADKLMYLKKQGMKE